MQSAFFGLITAFLTSVIVSPFIIKWFARLKNGQPILSYVELHQVKSGTPTMGGVIFIFGTVLSFIIFINDNIRLSTLCLAAMLGYGLLGFLDDFIKVKYKHNQGLRVYQKVVGQVGIATLIAIFVYYSGFVGSEIVVPFTHLSINLGWAIIPFVIFIFLATTNSVNLIDGLDGLAGGVSFVYLLGFCGVLFIHILWLEKNGESIIMLNELNNILKLSLMFAGAILGFLCFNSHKATIFMGDTGSLAIGGFISAACVLTKLYLYMPLLGIMFVITAISVIVQVLYYKATKKRVFLMAPIHHHFEKKGSYETKIVSIYIIITIISVVLTLAILMSGLQV